MRSSSIAPCRCGRETSDFKDILYRDRKVRKHLRPGEIDGCFDIKYYTRHTDRIFKKVGI